MGGISLTYDDEGQVATKGSATFAFDFNHRLKSIVDSLSSIFFDYDAQGNRLKATRDGVVTKYIYDASGNLLAEANDAGTILRYYIYGAGLLAQIDATTGDIYTYHFNNAGNTMAITDQTQEIVNSYSYTPFGIILAESENIDNPFKFAGQYGIMQESGSLFYMRARYYDASIGRFLSEDPLGFVDSPNLYQYALNNPIMNVDPLGLNVWIEGSSGDEPPFHQSINVGDPEGDYSSYSFGLDVSKFNIFGYGTGVVYSDVEKGGKIVKDSYLVTTSQEDLRVKEFLDALLGMESFYAIYSANCRSFSEKAFEEIKKAGIGKERLPTGK